MAFWVNVEEDPNKPFLYINLDMAREIRWATTHKGYFFEIKFNPGQATRHIVMEHKMPQSYHMIVQYLQFANFRTIPPPQQPPSEF